MDKLLFVLWNSFRRFPGSWGVVGGWTPGGGARGGRRKVRGKMGFRRFVKNLIKSKIGIKGDLGFSGDSITMGSGLMDRFRYY